MRDQISKARLQLLHPDARLIFQRFIEDCEEAFNIVIRIVQGLRTFEEQAVIYAQGRTKPGKIVTNAKPGQSYHQYGVAVDLGILKNNKIDWNFDYLRLLQFMPKEMVWGGNFKSIKDKPHFEITFGLNWKEMLKRYTKKDFITGTKYIRIK